jgi:hypothetical protein
LKATLYTRFTAGRHEHDAVKVGASTHPTLLVLGGAQPGDRLLRLRRTGSRLGAATGATRFLQLFCPNFFGILGGALVGRCHLLRWASRWQRDLLTIYGKLITQGM